MVASDNYTIKPTWWWWWTVIAPYLIAIDWRNFLKNKMMNGMIKTISNWFQNIMSVFLQHTTLDRPAAMLAQ